MRWKNAGLFFLMLLPGSMDARAPAPCGSLEACIQHLHALARLDRDYGSSMTQEEERLVEEIRRHPGAVDALVPLLEHPEDNVANIAAAALRDVPAIDPKYLPQINRGLDRGLGWLAPALARIGTQQAGEEAVARLIVSKSAPHNQEAYAVKLSGRRAVPAIVARAACQPSCSEDTHWILGAVLADMDEDARRAAAPGLMDVVVSAPDPLARQVLVMVGGLGSAGAALEPRLIALGRQRPSLMPNVDMALVGIRSSLTGTIYASRLKSAPDVLILRDLAETGHAGVGAGKVVVGLLGHPEAQIRVAAARTLGFIGYEPAAAVLVTKLEDPEDVRLAWTAAESLGRLHAVSAVAALNRTATTHWYAPVRESAKRALRHIRKRTPYPLQFHEKNFPFEFFAYQNIDQASGACEEFAERPREESKRSKLYARTSGPALRALSYATTVVSYGPEVGQETEADDDGIVRMTPDTMVEHRRTVSQVPSVALRTEQGWLVGGNRGEWGGELVYIGDDGVRQTLLERNVEDIFALGGRYVATVGLAHLSMNDGEVVALTRAPGGVWHAETWRVLPGAPSTSYLTRQSELLVTTVNGTGVVISPDGRMREAVCKRVDDTSRIDDATSEARAAADAAASAARDGRSR